jgi:2-haloacid dehalogenase
MNPYQSHARTGVLVDAVVFLERCGLNAGSTLFIDDSIRNVEAASGVGFNALVYRDARQLRMELAGFGLPVRL